MFILSINNCMTKKQANKAFNQDLRLKHDFMAIIKGFDLVVNIFKGILGI